MSALLDVSELTVGFRGTPAPSLQALDLTLPAGAAVGLVGASGSGKSLAARALLGLLPEGAQQLRGSIAFDGKPLVSEADFARVRGTGIAYVFQDAAASLHPLQRIGAQLHECLAQQRPRASASERHAHIHTALAEVGLDDAGPLLRRFPHQLSGGQRQRVTLALTLLPNPRLLIADEPTSALDPVLAQRVMRLLGELTRRRGMALLLISHDLPRIVELCAKVHVLDAGVCVESGAATELLAQPRHAATRRLTAALQVPPPVPTAPANAPPLLSAQALEIRYGSGRRWPWQAPAAPVLSNIELALAGGARLGVVGSSGSGKSTLARALIGLLPPQRGVVRWFEQDFARLNVRQRRHLRPRLQMVFQDPFRSLDPLQSVARMLDEGLQRKRGRTAVERAQRARELLLAVDLDDSALNRYPSQFSGGQRQRLAIARALATDPDVLVCDEATSALDSATQNQVLDLLDQLARERGIALLFISHDLGAVARLCQQVLVLEAGRVVEQGDANRRMAAPRSSALRELVEALPKSLRARLGKANGT